MIAGRVRQGLRLGATLLPLLLPAPVALAQGDAFDPHPLRPADTSSPRATLRSFLTSMERVLRELEAIEWDPAQGDFAARERAVETLDLSTTPHGDSFGVQGARLLLLKEILGRIELPPFDEIPGAREVAEGSITEWTVPDTRIRIRRVESGPRAGQFLFSAGTVERLERYYGRVRHLPYQPGASEGIYERFLAAENSAYALSRQVRHRLQPIDASSPRSTFEGFLESVNRAYRLVREADAALREDPPAIPTARALEMEARADDFLRRAQGALDLSQVPEAIRTQVGIETVLQLKEVLDRIALPPLDSIPGARSVRARRERATGRPLRWRVADTKLDLVEITEGERAGEFLFSAAAVERIGRDYGRLRDLPYRAPLLDALVADYRSPGTSPGFYEDFVATPGHLVPRATWQGRLIDGLPAWSRTLYAGQTLWQWIGLGLLGLLLLPLASWLAIGVVRGLSERVAAPWDGWLAILAPAAVAALVLVAVRVVDEQLNVTGRVFSVVTTGAAAIVIAMLVWGVFALCRAVAETLVASSARSDAQAELDASVTRIAARVIGFLLGVWIVVAGIRSLGLDVVPLVAGLGVGGLAVALAAQTTFANFIGSLILFTNKPVREGDFCRYGDQIGTVEEIGLHSTRIRSLERTVVSVPNAEFAQMQLDNFSKRDRRLLRTTLALRIETTPEQLRCVLAELRQLLLGHPMVTPDPARVRFVGHGPHSKNVEIFAYLRCQDQNTFLAIQEDLLLRIEDIVRDAGTAFAVPAQTAYLTQDTALDAERRHEAEARVEQWRAEDRLPFPEFAPEERRHLTDVIEYPPPGSHDYRPPSDPGAAPPESPAPGRRRPSWLGSLRRRR